MLYRPIANGKEFEKLIPKPPGNKTALGIGNTDYSIQAMEQMVKDFYPQMGKVAVLLEKSSLQSTTKAVKDFCFNNFQYKADQEDQLLRSPSYAFWIDRKTGIDCKSYSIIASCILTNLGINHYIRKIKQPGFSPTEWTHVYVIVPVDQKTNNLNFGYYTIDGTLEEDIEPAHNDTSDILMSLQHYRLNGYNPKSLGLSAFGFDLSNLKSLKSFISQLGCIGGSAYTEPKMKEYLGKMELYFNNLIDKINQAVVDKNEVAFANSVAEFYAVAQLGVTASEKKLSEGWNTCSENVIKVIIQAFKFYNKDVNQALTAWLNDGFIVNGKNGLKIFKSDDLYSVHGIGGTSKGLILGSPIYLYSPKAKTIKRFEITPYVADLSSTTTSFNPLQFISGLSTALASFSPNTSDGASDGFNLENQTGNNAAPTQTAGLGTAGWLIIAVGVAVAIKGFSNTETPKK